MTVDLSKDEVTIGGGADKLNVGTIDPVFDINGKKYATYVIEFAGGTRVEIAGNVNLKKESERATLSLILKERKREAIFGCFGKFLTKNWKI